MYAKAVQAPTIGDSSAQQQVAALSLSGSRDGSHRSTVGAGGLTAARPDRVPIFAFARTAARLRRIFAASLPVQIDFA
jgi:hypothetical protein